MKLDFERIARLLVSLYSFFPALGIPLWVSWLELDGELPSRIATHWGVTGQADGFMSPSVFATTMAIICGFFALLISWLLWTRRLPHLTRWVIVVPILAIYLGVLNLVIESVLAHRGIEDPSQVSLSATAFIWLFAAIPLILGFTLSMPRVAVVENRVDVTVWAILIYRISLDDVQSIEEVHLRARDYGGLGLRFGKDGFAIIPRPGVGVRITAKDGKRVLVRCSNAAEISKSLDGRES